MSIFIRPEYLLVGKLILFIKMRFECGLSVGVEAGPCSRNSACPSCKIWEAEMSKKGKGLCARGR